MVDTKVKAKRVSKKPYYTVLHLPTGQYIKGTEAAAHDGWSRRCYDSTLFANVVKDTDTKLSNYSGKVIETSTKQFKTENEAYEFLLKNSFSQYSYASRRTSMTVMLMMCELSKTNPTIVYDIFLPDRANTGIVNMRPINHVGIMSYLRKHKLFKEGFKAYSNMVALAGLGYVGKFCFEHFAVDEHSYDEDINTL